MIEILKERQRDAQLDPDYADPIQGLPRQFHPGYELTVYTNSGCFFYGQLSLIGDGFFRLLRYRLGFGLLSRRAGLLACRGIEWVGWEHRLPVLSLFFVVPRSSMDFVDCRVCQMTARRFITKSSARTWPTSMGTAALKSLKIFSPSDELVVHKLETIIDGLPVRTRWLVGDRSLFDLISKDMWRGTVQNVRRATANQPSRRRRNRRADQQSAEGASWGMEAGWVGFDEVAHQHGICRRLTTLTESSHEDF